MLLLLDCVWHFFFMAPEVFGFIMVTVPLFNKSTAVCVTVVVHGVTAALFMGLIDSTEGLGLYVVTWEF